MKVPRTDNAKLAVGPIVAVAALVASVGLLTILGLTRRSASLPHDKGRLAGPGNVA